MEQLSTFNNTKNVEKLLFPFRIERLLLLIGGINNMTCHKNHLGLNLDQNKKNIIWDFCESYKDFLNKGKTERESVKEIQAICESKGFKEASQVESVKTGDKIYYINRNKNLVAFVVGRKPIKEGINLIASHLDSPRLDLKPMPLVEEEELAMLKTHYYGGVKKYQWASLPLALHGVVFLSNGKKIEISLGEKEEEPVFVLPDLLPHLDRKVQRERKAEEVIRGEEMRILIGSLPKEGKEIKNPVKEAILDHLKSNYDILEEDFISAELEIVPAGKARDVGIDSSMVGAYGQDDRICAYTSLRALLDLEEAPEKTAMVFFADKEEIGSTGSTGMQSNYFVYTITDLLAKLGESTDNHNLLKTLWSSSCLSADVCAGVNPIFKEVHDLTNAPRLNYGIVITKYTGHGGKSLASDADAEFVFEIKQLFKENQVGWQAGLLGKVDEGGGGTVAKFVAQWGVRTLDCGPALLSMHSPFEISAKTDIWASYQAYKAFLKKSI